MLVTPVRTPRKAEYDKNPSIDATIAYSVGGGAPTVLVALKQEALRARRSDLAIAILVMRLVIVGAGMRLSPRAEISSLKMRVCETLRHTDTVGQLPDSEVLAVLPGADLPGAEAAARRLIAAHARRPQAKHLDFVIGPACLGADEGDLAAMIERGRANRIEVEDKDDAPGRAAL